MMVLAMASRLTDDIAVRFSALCRDLGKVLPGRKLASPSRTWPCGCSFRLRALCQRYRIPNQIRDLAKLAAKYHDHLHRIENAPLKNNSTFSMRLMLGANQTIDQLAIISEADARGRQGSEICLIPQGIFFRPSL